MNTIGTALIGIALAGMVAIELFWTPGWMSRIRQAIASGSVSARTEMYQLIVGLDWVYAVIALVLMLGAGLSLNEIGLRWPNDQAKNFIGFAVALVVGSGLGVILAGRQSKKSVKPKIIGDIDVLIPRTKAERWWFAAAAMSAGITEEVSLRAMPILFFRDVLPGHSDIAAVAVAAVIFGLAHYYQGVAGVLGTAVLGAAFGGIFVATDSLLIPMALHCLLDLRVLLVPTPKQQFEVDA